MEYMDILLRPNY